MEVCHTGTLTEEPKTELCQKASIGVPKAAVSRHYAISRETLYNYLRAGMPSSLSSAPGYKTKSHDAWTAPLGFVD